MEKYFRMPQECFEKLFTDLRPYIQNSKGFQHPISVEKQVTATLYYLVDEGRLRKMTNSFGIEKSILSGVLFLLLFTLENFSLVSI